MATVMTKRGSLDNVITYEHYCDTTDDLENINPEFITLGSIAVVLSGENDTLEVYIAKSDKTWVQLS